MLNYSEMLENIAKSNISKNEKLEFMKLIRKKITLDDELKKLSVLLKND